MKKVLALVLALALVMSMMIIPSFAEDDNLVDDATVDNDEIITVWTNGWQNGLAQEWFNDSVLDDGSGCIHLQNAASGNQHCTQPVTLLAGNTYIVSGWIKVDDTYNCNCAGACGAYIAINLPRAEGIPSGQYAGQAGYCDTNETVSGWQYFENTYTPEEDMDAFVSLCLWGTGGDAYFDNIYVGVAGSPYAPATTGDAAIIAAVVISVALAAAVVFSKKKENA